MGVRWGRCPPDLASLAWFVREAWPSPYTGIEHTEGILDEGEELSLSRLRIPRAFGDGMESDRLTLTWAKAYGFARPARPVLVDPAGWRRLRP